MILISQLRKINPAGLADATQTWVDLIHRFADVMYMLRRDVDTTMSSWKGDAAAAAAVRAEGDTLAANNVTTAADAQIEVLEPAVGSLGHARATALAIVDEAETSGCAVTDHGHVTATDRRFPIDSVSWIIAQVSAGTRAAALQHRLIAALQTFDDLDTQAAAALDAATDHVEALARRLEASRTSRDVLDILHDRRQPPDDPKDFHHWWIGLSPAEKDDLWAHDRYLGNHDGIPAIDRDHYNRLTLHDELDRARHGDPAVVSRLDDLQTLQAAINKTSDTHYKVGRMLMLLDTQSGELSHAAVAIGNPDFATHVSVTTPGLGTTVSSAFHDHGMADEAEALAHTTDIELNKYGRGSETTASIAWLGYDAPQMNEGDIVDRAIGAAEVATPFDARAAAPVLASFYHGLMATHHGYLHLTAIGHSYGCLVTGLALQQPGPRGVDDVLVYGSPGLDADPMPLYNMHISPGHAFEMTAHEDPVAHTNQFGLSPGYMPQFTHLSTDATTTPDGVHREGALGHSEYPRPGSNLQLRTSGYNAAIVVGGLTAIPHALITGPPAIEKGAQDLWNLSTHAAAESADEIPLDGL